MNKITRIAIAIIVCLTVGYSSSTVTKSGVETWYPTIAKPVFNPPGRYPNRLGRSGAIFF
jgi:tryptophan-rich sensory protein